MPFNPANASPGVYVYEIPSGVHTITGVATSITAFVGLAKAGPVNVATRVLSFADYERNFGGLVSYSQMSYAVQQFFLNGGSEAWIVRVVSPSTGTDSRKIPNGQTQVLQVDALSPGETDRTTDVFIDLAQSDPPTFTLTVVSTPKSTGGSGATNVPKDVAVESFKELSMDQTKPNYVVKKVNATSNLVKVTNLVKDGTTLPAATPDSHGKLTSQTISVNIVKNWPNLPHEAITASKSFRITLDGTSPYTITPIPKAGAGKQFADLDDAAQAITKAVQALKLADPVYSGFTCSVDGSKLVLTSGSSGSNSSVTVQALANDTLANDLQLANGTQTSATTATDHGKLTSQTISVDIVKNWPHEAITASKSFRITLDGTSPYTITPIPKAGAGKQFADLDDAAQAITKAVQALKPADPAYNGFICSVKDGSKPDSKLLVLTSGSYGSNSSVTVQALANDTLANDLQLANGTQTSTTTALELMGGAAGGSPTTAEEFDMFIGSRANYEGIYALDKVDLFNLLCLPGVTDPKILGPVDIYCQERRAFMIADPPQGLSPNEMYNAITDTTPGHIIPKTDHGATYYPWIKLPDPLDSGNIKDFPPSGTIAGLYARTDNNRGVWKAPAGTEATLAGAQGLEDKLNDGENGILNSRAVNCLRVFPAYGTICWGARTLLGNDDAGAEYKYVPVRRTALYIEESLYRGLQWVVFEPNDEPLWAQIRLNVGAFMHNLFVKGAFQGTTPKDAYFVKCDKETNPQNQIDLGIVNIIVGFAPLKPAEFVVISIQQMAGQIQV